MPPFQIIRPNPANFGGPRSLSAITLIVNHCTEGSTALGAANYWARPVVQQGTEGSAHVAFDDTTAIRAVDDDVVAYGAFQVNEFALHIEMAGFVAWTRSEWLAHLPTLEQAAIFQGQAHKKYDIPFVESTTHGYHSHAGLPGNDHTDPGPNFPWDVYLPMVKAAIDGHPTYTLKERLMASWPFGSRSADIVIARLRAGYQGTIPNPTDSALFRDLRAHGFGRVSAQRIVKAQRRKESK